MNLSNIYFVYLYTSFFIYAQQTLKYFVWSWWVRINKLLITGSGTNVTSSQGLWNILIFISTILHSKKIHITSSFLECLLCYSTKRKALSNRLRAVILRIAEEKSMRYEKSPSEKSEQLYYDPKHLHREQRAPVGKSVCEKRENTAWFKMDRVEVKKSGHF